MDITKFVVSHRDNALLIGDYKTYHHQLTKQLASLRKKLGRSTPRNGKFAKKAAVSAEDIGANVEYVVSCPLQDFSRYWKKTDVSNLDSCTCCSCRRNGRLRTR